MRSWILSIALVTAAVSVQGCGTTSTDMPTMTETASGVRVADTTPDGLVRVESNTTGNLYIRPEHGIGGYDAIIVAPAFVNYRRASAKLDPDIEIGYLAALEQSLVDLAEEAGVPIVNAPDQCAITVGIGFVNVALARSDNAPVLGEMILVMQYEDSMSGQSLLLFTAPKRIEHEAEGVTREEQVHRSFDQMIEEVDIIRSLRSATTTPSGPREGCEGLLVKVGDRAVEQSQSTQ